MKGALDRSLKLTPQGLKEPAQPPSLMCDSRPPNGRRKPRANIAPHRLSRRPAL